MSLDVYLTVPNPEACNAACEHCTVSPTLVVYDCNITHNLNRMADVAGIYKALWHPEEVGIKKAKDMIRPLSEGVWFLKNNPETCKKLNQANGWGSYDDFVPWVERLLAECREHPNADVRVSR